MSSNLRIDLSWMRPRPGPATRSGRRRRRGSSWLRRLAVAAVLTPIGLVAPFVVVLRGSLEAQQRFDFATIPAVTLGVVTAAVLLFLIAWIVAKVLRFPRGIRWIMSRGGGLAVFGMVGMGLTTIAAEHVKSPELTAEYRSLHPLLRLATSTLVLLDPRAVVTDASRTPDDYAAWGMPSYDRSLHFVQDDGYAHAVDLRTLGRPEWRNRLTRAGLQLMGFSTLRHTGTADHLHVEVPRR